MIELTGVARLTSALPKWSAAWRALGALRLAVIPAQQEQLAFHTSNRFMQVIPVSRLSLLRAMGYVHRLLGVNAENQHVLGNWMAVGRTCYWKLVILSSDLKIATGTYCMPYAPRISCSTSRVIKIFRRLTPLSCIFNRQLGIDDLGSRRTCPTALGFFNSGTTQDVTSGCDRPTAPTCLSSAKSLEYGQVSHGPASAGSSTAWELCPRQRNSTATRMFPGMRYNSARGPRIA